MFFYFLFFFARGSNHGQSAIYYNVHKTQACISSMMTTINPPEVMMNWLLEKEAAPARLPSALGSL